MRIGILGGAFNPPHIGHLVCAQEALVQFGLDRVVMMPMGTAPHREIQQDPGAEVRLEMCDLAVAADARFDLSREEVDKDGPAYTFETLRALREREPEAELFLILGGDQAAALPSWREPEEVLSLATLLVAARSGYTRDAVGLSVSRLRGSERIRFFDMPRIDVSSTMVRRRAAAGKPVRYLVPDKVADLMAAKNLYAPAAPAAAA